MTNITAIENKANLKLTEWELKNLHLPPVTTVILYEGSAPVENLRTRAGELGILMVTRRFDSDMLIELKAQDGLKIPTGVRIV